MDGVTAAQHFEWTSATECLNVVNMVSFKLCIHYHNKKKFRGQ
jgi:hypothetical protein